MKDLMRSKKIVNKRVIQPTQNTETSRSYVEANELDEDLNRGCKSNGCKPQCHPYVQCDDRDDHNCNCNDHNHDHNHNHNHNHNHHNCGCNTDCCNCQDDDCTENCFPNPCQEECSHPLIPPKFSTSQAKLYPIETDRIFDTIMFRVFTDGKMLNGDDLNFRYELGNLCGPLPCSVQTNVTIEKVCINYSSITINPGTTSLEQLDIEKVDGKKEKCKSVFEYNVCGQLNRCCNDRCLGQNVMYKEKGLNVVVHDLEIELTGRFGCSEFTAIATPYSKCDSNCVVFYFNTLSSDLVVPADGRSFTLRQDFQTQLTVDCIGKGIITQEIINNKPCFELDIPNGIDLVLCLQNIVSVLIKEQIVVLGGPTRIQPRLVDTFGSVCDFSQFTGSCDNDRRQGSCDNDRR
ncbi:hypothetical protein [Paeniclostridium hominis]|uniref:hypothetical protein n=1 Tax=Paeniclostridium hominis TaxID=2764329 RepID=UPI0022E2B6FD|nr:hypothetical protein [Paeniclostridium hominis]